MRIRVKSRTPATKLLAVALACAALAACAGDRQRSIPAEDPSGYQLKQEPHLQVTEYRQDVQFLSGSATLARASEQALRSFLGGIARGDRVFVVAGAPDPSGLRERRGRAVTTILASHRVQSQSRFTDDDVPPPDGIAVVSSGASLRCPPVRTGRKRPTGASTTSR